MIWNNYVGKQVFIILNNNRRYSGIFKEAEFIGKDSFGADMYIISIIDKFGKWVSFSSKEIELIDEEERRW